MKPRERDEVIEPYGEDGYTEIATCGEMRAEEKRGFSCLRAKTIMQAAMSDPHNAVNQNGQRYDQIHKNWNEMSNSDRSFEIRFDYEDRVDLIQDEFEATMANMDPSEYIKNDDNEEFQP